MSSRPILIVAVIAAAAAASGCGGMSRALGMSKVTPDEFRVVTRAPLTLPPDYSLRPPQPGEARPQELQPDEEAHAALFGQDTGQNASAGERALVTNAGAEAVDPDVRTTVDFEGANVVHRSPTLSDRVINAPAGATTSTDAATAATDAEAIRRVTGGQPVVIERRDTGTKLPGT